MTKTRTAFEEALDGVYAALVVNATGEFGSISPTYEEAAVLGQVDKVAAPAGSPPLNPDPDLGKGPVKLRVNVATVVTLDTVTAPLDVEFLPIPDLVTVALLNEAVKLV